MGYIISKQKYLNNNTNNSNNNNNNNNNNNSNNNNPTDRITHTTAFVTPVVDHWLERLVLEYPAFQ